MPFILDQPEQGYVVLSCQQPPITSVTSRNERAPRYVLTTCRPATTDAACSVESYERLSTCDVVFHMATCVDEEGRPSTVAVLRNFAEDLRSIGSQFRGGATTRRPCALADRDVQEYEKDTGTKKS
jgi:hypothetical protein